MSLEVGERGKVLSTCSRYDGTLTVSRRPLSTTVYLAMTVHNCSTFVV